MSTNDHTKIIQTLDVSDAFVDTIVPSERRKEIQTQVAETNKKIPSLLEGFEKLTKKNNGWIEIENTEVFYQALAQALFPPFATFDFGHYYEGYENFQPVVNSTFAGYEGSLIRESEFALLQNHTPLFQPFLNNIRSVIWEEKILASGWEGFSLEGDNFLGRQYGDINTPLQNDFEELTKGCGYGTTCFEIPVHRFPSQSTSAGCLFQLLKENLIPKEFTPREKRLFQDLVTLLQTCPDCVAHLGESLTLLPDVIVNQAQITSLTGTDFSPLAIKAELTKNATISHPDAENALFEALSTQYLECDTRRADLDPYNIKILTDPNRGHWDVWDMKQEGENPYKIKLSEPLVGRNPVADVKSDGIIGIDFGTKSTVVVYQENSEHTLPLRVGTGRLSKKIQASHYENPTVMEFVDLTSFLTAYNEKAGRPDTLWEQVLTSHTAFDDLLGSNSNQYYSFLYELKQWAGDSSRKLHLRDKQNEDFLLNPYQQLKEGEFDPIEIYAYYLGLYINNMHNGIYLNYLLSYPVTYEKEVRDRILASFERGFKKSLPTALLENQEAMKRFSVKLGASEPVSYAICALEEYGFEPDVGEEVFYAVFDFGGGTSDFDFGLFRGVDEDKHDFVVESFGSSGDQYLGGENLLELLAFEAFKSNQDVVRECSIPFERPPQCKRFAGDEVLIADSQEAKLNMEQLKEALRPLWERHEDYGELYEEGAIKVNLFDNQGNPLLNQELEVSLEHLEEVLTTRIEQGVTNFFQSLIRTLNLPKNTNSVDMIHILLAGNSSKSAILRQVMDKHMAHFNQVISETAHSSDVKNYFTVFPPLGTEEADQFLQSQGMTPKPRTIESPTCKTGVAFGLVGSRQGSRIKLIRETETTEEVKFPYFLGKERRRKFKFVSEPSLGYGNWVKFTDATEENFTLFYSRLPSVVMGDTPITNVERKLCYLDETFSHGFVYFRAVSPSEVEYVVATEEGILQEDFLTQAVKISLEDV